MTSAREILDRLEGAKPSASHGGWVAVCPVCGDPGLTLTVAHNNGVPVMTCVAGCPHGRVRAALSRPASGGDGGGG